MLINYDWLFAQSNMMEPNFTADQMSPFLQGPSNTRNCQFIKKYKGVSLFIYLVLPLILYLI